MVEVRLSPEELGRVKLSMTSGEAGMTVQIIAERAETLDLIRRNIDLLAADLHKQGFSNLSFSFGGGGSSDQPGQDEEPESTSDWNSAEVPDTSPSRIGEINVAEARVDIRL